MTSIRLLPVVIFAGVALLGLKGVGLLTNGGYVLGGSGTAQAAGASDGGHGGAAAEGGEPTMTLPGEHVLTDTNPTLTDGAPTLPLGGAGEGAHGAPAEDHGSGAGEATEDEPSAEEDQHGSTAAGAVACPPAGEAATDAGGHGAPPTAENAADCPPPVPVNAAGDALPQVQDGAGNIVPLGAEATSESAVLERLGERRDELETREAELEMRMALIEAAEKRLEERTSTLQALQARIDAMVAQQKEAEEGQLASIIAMYETMKPKEAAEIFDQLDMAVLLQVALAMNPRKMGPIMARMDPIKAKDLTANMARQEAEESPGVTEQDLLALPQIVGQ